MNKTQTPEATHRTDPMRKANGLQTKWADGISRRRSLQTQPPVKQPKTNSERAVRIRLLENYLPSNLCIIHWHSNPNIQCESKQRWGDHLHSTCNESKWRHLLFSLSSRQFFRSLAIMTKKPFDSGKQPAMIAKWCPSQLELSCRWLSVWKTQYALFAVSSWWLTFEYAATKDCGCIRLSAKECLLHTPTKMKGLKFL